MDQNYKHLERKEKIKVYLAACANCAGAFLFGYTTAIISGAMLTIAPYFKIENSELLKGLLVSILLLGAMIGSVCAGKIADKIGRRRALLMDDFIFILGTVLCTIAPDYWVLLVGRFIVGLGVGVASTVVPLFITEISPSKIRGSIGVLNQLFITIGILVAFFFNFALANVAMNLNWRIMFFIAIVPSFLHLVYSYFRRIESPKWLLLKGNLQEAREMLHKLREVSNISSELDELANEESQTTSINDSTTFGGDYETPTTKKPFIIAIAVNFFQQAVGVNAILYYLATFLNMAGFSKTIAPLASILIGAINVIMTFVSAAIVEKAGRKPLLLWGYFGNTFCLILIGVFLKLKGHVFSGTASGMLCLICVVVYILFFAIGPAPMTWVIITEIFPSHNRGVAMSISIMVNWLVNFLISLFFLQFISWFGIPVVFWIFGVIAIFAFLFVFFFVVETKGKSIAAIYKEF